MHLVVDRRAFSDGVHTHAFDDTRDLFEEVFRARIYAGFHCAHSLRDGGTMGRRIARQLVRTRSRCQKDGGDDDDGGDEDDHRER